MKDIKFEFKPYRITLINEHESFIIKASTDKVRQYSRTYQLDKYKPSSEHGVLVENTLTNQTNSCILKSGGGATGVHEHSLVVVNNECFVAVGDKIVSLSLPSLNLIWAKQLDWATCFGVYYVQDKECLIIHGELAITKVLLNGEELWSQCGKDIFTGSLKILFDHIEVEDFNAERYSIDIDQGSCKILH